MPAKSAVKARLAIDPPGASCVPSSSGSISSDPQKQSAFNQIRETDAILALRPFGPLPPAPGFKPHANPTKDPSDTRPADGVRSLCPVSQLATPRNRRHPLHGRCALQRERPILRSRAGAQERDGRLLLGGRHATVRPTTPGLRKRPHARGRRRTRLLRRVRLPTGTHLLHQQLGRQHPAPDAKRSRPRRRAHAAHALSPRSRTRTGEPRQPRHKRPNGPPRARPRTRDLRQPRGRLLSITITIRQPTNPNTVFAHTLVNIPAIEPHPLTITLDRAAKRLLAHHHSIEALIVTSTTSGEGPATQTEYPLTIIAPKHSRKPKEMGG